MVATGSVRDTGLGQERRWGGGKEPGASIALGEVVSVVLLVNAPSRTCSQLLLRGGHQAPERLLLGLEMLFSGNKQCPGVLGQVGWQQKTRWLLMAADQKWHLR